MDGIHKTQIHILTKLLFSTELSYSDLKPRKNMGNNLFQHHLDMLTKQGWVLKRDSGYKLSQTGKQFAMEIGTKEKQIVKKPMIAVNMVCTRRGKKETEYLFYTRKKEPWFDCQGFPAGKVHFGESAYETAKRELKEETGLSGKPQLARIVRAFDIDRKEQQVLSDIMFLLFVFENPTGKLVSSNEGIYEWIPESQVPAFVKKPFATLESLLEDIECSKNITGLVKYEEKYSGENSNF